MTPQEKAKELVEKFSLLKEQGKDDTNKTVIQWGTETADMAIEWQIEDINKINNRIAYWQQVKEEIQKL